MAVKMYQEGYLKLDYSNNLGAKYAFSLPNEAFTAAFGQMSADDLLFLRAKLSVARFFPDANQLVAFIADVFTQRVGNGLAMADIADIFGKNIDEGKLLNVAKTYIEGSGDPAAVQQQIATLTQDEKMILAQYLSIYNILKAGNQEQYQGFVQQLMGQSLGGGSQLIILELP